MRFLGLLSAIVFTALFGSLLDASSVNAQSAYDDNLQIVENLYVRFDNDSINEDVTYRWGGILADKCGVTIDHNLPLAVTQYSPNPATNEHMTVRIWQPSASQNWDWEWITGGIRTLYDSQVWTLVPDNSEPDNIACNEILLTTNPNATQIISTVSGISKVFIAPGWNYNYPGGYEGPEVPEVAPEPDKEAITEWALHGDNDGTLKVNYLDNLPFIAKGLTEYELWEANDDWELTTQVLADDIQPTQGVELTFFESLDSNKNYIWLASYQPIEDGWIPAISAIGFNYTGRPFFMTNQGCTSTIREGSLIGDTHYCNPLDPNTPGANQASGIAQIMTGQNFLSDEVNLLIDIATLPIGIIGKASNYKTECVPKNASVMGGQITLPCIENHLRGLGTSTVNNMINFVIDMYQTVLLVSVILGTTSISIAVMLNLINPLGSMKMWWPW